MIESLPTVRLELDSRRERVTLVRGVLARLGELVAFDAAFLDDLRTAVSEACNNVVLHAYGGEPGPLLLDLKLTRDGVEIVIRDRGRGIRQIVSSDNGMGVGLALIGALADRAEFVSAPEGGTEVRMSFIGRRAAWELADPRATETGVGPAPCLSGDVVATLSPVSMLPAVLGHVARVLAARAYFSLDRLSELQLVADLIATYAPSAASSASIGFAIVANDRRLELTVGPFQVGSSAQLQDKPSLQRPALPLAQLADQLAVVKVDDAEMFRVVLVDHCRTANGTPS